MTAIKKRKIDAALRGKGFKKEDKHHSYYYLHVDGYDVGIFTKLSHGSGGKDIPEIILHKMARQIGIEYKEFIELIDCTLGKDDLVKRKIPSNRIAIYSLLNSLCNFSSFSFLGYGYFLWSSSITLSL